MNDLENSSCKYCLVVITENEAHFLTIGTICEILFGLIQENDKKKPQIWPRNLDHLLTLTIRSFLLQATSEESLKKLEETLKENNIDHKLWVEQPENFPTCLATKPYQKDIVQNYFKKFKLYK